MTQLLADEPTGVRAGTDADLHVVIDAAVAAFRGSAFHDVTYDAVVEQSGLHEAVVRSLFPDWDGLLIATIETWNTRLLEAIQPVAQQHGAVAFLRAMLLANIADPARVRLMAAMVPIAATAGHPMSGFLRQEWLRVPAVVQRALIRDVETGREASTVDCARGAEQLVALFEGLQLQAMVRPGMRLLESFDRAVARTEDGWTQALTARVWEI